MKVNEIGPVVSEEKLQQMTDEQPLVNVIKWPWPLEFRIIEADDISTSQSTTGRVKMHLFSVSID